MKGLIVQIKKLITRIYLKLIPKIKLNNTTLEQNALDDTWKLRIKEVLLCPDNVYIKRVPNAGIIKKGIQTMHNDIKIYAGGYYGDGISQMLLENKGVHEPQEELAFGTIVSTLPTDAKMLELGAYWSFYSLWFKKQCPSGVNYMIEPGEENIELGKRNFKLNNFKGIFFKSFISNRQDSDLNENCVCVDDFVNDNNIDFLHILHSDIQGYELKMLEGAQNTIDSKKIAYIFISSHGNEIHNDCISFLTKNDFIILCEANPFESYSYDGLIVAKSKSYEGIEKIEISKNSLNLYEKIF